MKFIERQKKYMSKCIGCGTTLQTTDPNKPGYIPVSVEINKEYY